MTKVEFFNNSEWLKKYTTDSQRTFQTPASPIAEGIFSFHDDLMIFLTGILVFVRYIRYICRQTFGHNVTEKARTPYVERRLIHAPVLEVIWTIVPALLLIVIAIPSFSLLYSIDEIIEPLFTVKVVGHQWYWSYEFLDPEVVAKLYNDSFSGYDEAILFKTESSGGFDSYMRGTKELKNGEGLTSYRLLTVDNHLFLPTKRHVRAIVTSADVLHCWTVPSLGFKLDACPGRLNQTSIYIKRKGIYYGQCSEICGVNHGFRPIGIVSQGFFASLLPRQGLDFEPLLAVLQSLALE